ncbi:MAG TPA: hypothetical protein VNA04_05835 [Thermoanaerobaculia bacterium]|nr:hypothetical protein [Thermoanaerobaculia bacterium]
MRLYDRIAAALLWVAAFSFAAGVFFSITLLFRGFPPTDPVAIGIVTIERYSKLKDYLTAAVFFLTVPPLAVWLQHAGRRLIGHEQRRFRTRTPERDLAVTILFTVPLMLSPVFHLTTGKVGWILLLPAALAFGGVRGFHLLESSSALRRLFRRELFPYHALLFGEGAAWLLYRYLVRGHRIAHYPTLFLEIVFVALFLAIFFAVAVLISRIVEMSFGRPAGEVLRRIACGALPLVLLPLVPLFWVTTKHPVAVVVVAVMLSAGLATLLRRPLSATTARRLAAWVILPFLIYVFSYASTAHHTQWIDLFHRGESIGPASDYLRGKVPYRDVFVLHGLLEDGMLDAWLMKVFGRDLEVALARTVVVGGLLAVSLWILGMAVFDSIPLALLVVGMSAWITAENNRTFFQVAAVALLWMALSRGRAAAAFAAGAFGGVALFFSYEIGLYTAAGAVATMVVLALLSRRVGWTGMPPWRALAWFGAGFAAAAAPFVVYLTWQGVLGEFLQISFVTIPRIIDAVWSLPFPDLVSTFRRDLTLQKLADFVLWEKFRLILSPLTIAIAATYLIQRVVRRRFEMFDASLLLLTIFATVTQRTAFGRAEFRHQYFAAFLVGPMLVILGILAARRLAAIWRRGGEGSRAFVVAVAIAAAPVIAVVLWVPDVVNGRLEDLMNYQRRVLRVQRDGRAEEVAYRIRYVSEEIRRLVRRREPIFDFSNQPAFYFFADRMNPTRFYQIPIASPRRFQAEIITALERTRTRVILRTSPERFDEFDGVPNAVRAQAVAAYIDDCYRFFASVRGVEIWKREPGAKAAPLESYLRRIRLPEKGDTVASARARMVFPAVGSSPGAAGSFWISDLTLHNPFREPITMSLRFIGPFDRVDRRMTLGPRQTVRLPDLVRTYFGARGVGTLWIQHREGRAPVAVIKTADVTRGGRPSVEGPLTRRHSVTAGTENAELIIVGIPEARSPGRRINAGVVNVGIIPATFRISARTRSGQPVGGSVESGIPEDEVWMVHDIETQLGVRLDETTTLRFSAIAGTGVAFATIVEENGDSEFIGAHPTQQE